MNIKQSFKYIFSRIVCAELAYQTSKNRAKEEKKVFVIYELHRIESQIWLD